VACLVAAVAGAVVVKSARKVAPQAPLSAPAEC